MFIPLRSVGANCFPYMCGVTPFTALLPISFIEVLLFCAALKGMVRIMPLLPPLNLASTLISPALWNLCVLVIRNKTSCWQQPFPLNWNFPPLFNLKYHLFRFAFLALFWGNIFFVAIACHCKLIEHVGDCWKYCPQDVIFSLVPKRYSRILPELEKQNWREQL